MKCPIDGCKGRADTDTQMYQHVNKYHQGETYTPQYEDTEEKEAPKKYKKEKDPVIEKPKLWPKAETI